MNRITEEYKEYNLNTVMYTSKFVKDLNLNRFNPIYNEITQQLNDFSFIALPRDKEILIGIDKKGVLKNFINPKNDGNYENEILIVEININNEILRYDLKIIETDSPKNLKETLVKFLENIKKWIIGSDLNLL